MIWQQLHSLIGSYPLALRGLGMTVVLSLISLALGTLIGFALGVLRAGDSRTLSGVIGAWVDLIRGTPFLVQIFLIFFGLPRAGIMLSSNQAALLAMVVNVGAYATEIVRAGIEGISRGQIEAGLALGLRPLQVFRYVVLFPALAIVYPALSSQFILLMLSSSVVSTISAQELTATANDIQSRTFRSFEIYIVVTGIYLALSMLFSAAFGGIHRAVFARPGAR